MHATQRRIRSGSLNGCFRSVLHTASTIEEYRFSDIVFYSGGILLDGRHGKMENVEHAVVERSLSRRLGRALRWSVDARERRPRLSLTVGGVAVKASVPYRYFGARRHVFPGSGARTRSLPRRPNPGVAYRLDVNCVPSSGLAVVSFRSLSLPKHLLSLYPAATPRRFFKF